MQRKHIISYPVVAVLALGLGVWRGGQPVQQSNIQDVVKATIVPSESSPTGPANPVPILKKITGCILEAGAKNGRPDVFGGRFSSCYFMDNGDHSQGTDVTIYAYPGDPKQFNSKLTTPSDGTAIILGSDFAVIITYIAGDTSSPAVDLSQIATQVGGQVIQ